MKFKKSEVLTKYCIYLDLNLHSSLSIGTCIEVRKALMIG